LDPRIFENLASDKYLGPRTSSVKSPQWLYHMWSDTWNIQHDALLESLQVVSGDYVAGMHLLSNLLAQELPRQKV